MKKTATSKKPKKKSSKKPRLSKKQQISLCKEYAMQIVRIFSPDADGEAEGGIILNSLAIASSICCFVLKCPPKCFVDDFMEKYKITADQ